MHQPFSLPAGNRVKNRRQAYALLLLGVVFLFIAWLGILNPYAVGVVLFGLGMLAVAPLNPRRYLSAGWLTTSLGVATFLMFRNYIPASLVLTAHLLAIGLGLLGIAWMAQRGYTSRGELTPGLFVVGVGVTEFLQAAHLTPSPLVPFALSLWLHIPNFFKRVVAEYLLAPVVGSASLPAAISSAIVAGCSQPSFLYTHCRVLGPHLDSLPGNRPRFS